MKRPALAWMIFATKAVCGAGAALLPDKNWPLRAILFLAVVMILASAFATLVAAKRPDNLVGWTLLWICLSLAGGLFATQWAQRALVVRPGSLPDGIDIDALTSDVRDIVARAMRPRQATLWTRR